MHVLAAALTTSHGHTSQEAETAELVPAAYGTPLAGFEGLRADADWDVARVGANGRLALVALAEGRLELREAGGEHGGSLQRDLALGARWRPVPDLDLVPDLTLALDTVSAGSWRGTVEAPEPFTAARYGIAPGAGLAFPIALDLDVRLDASLLFAPLPVDERLGLTADLPSLGAPVRARVGLELDHRGWNVGGDGPLRQTRLVGVLGISAPL